MPKNNNFRGIISNNGSCDKEGSPRNDEQEEDAEKVGDLDTSQLNIKADNATSIRHTGRISANQRKSYDFSQTNPSKTPQPNLGGSRKIGGADYATGAS